MGSKKLLMKFSLVTLKKLNMTLNLKIYLLLLTTVNLLKYQEVPHQLYTQFRMTESQGKFFSGKIRKRLSIKNFNN